MSWLNRKKWEDMWNGHDCPMCKDIHLSENEFSYKIRDFKSSVWRLPKRHHPKGYTMVAARVHAPEVFLMDPVERRQFFEEIAVAAGAISELFRPVKIHYGIFGSLCPHVHCHLIPKYESDDPHGAVLFGDTNALLQSEEGQMMISQLNRIVEGREENALR